MSINKDWFLDEQLWLEFYQTMFSEQQFDIAAEQTPQLINLSGLEPENILDLACGPGRHVLPLASSGYKLTAVDTSEYLLGRLEQGLKETGLAEQVEVVRADMREFCRNDSYDLALSMWTSFGYFDHVGDDQLVLQNVYASLREGGKFLLDVAGKEYILHNYEPILVRELEGEDLLVEHPVLSDNMSRLENDWTLISGENVYRAQFSLNIYTAIELQSLLFEAGFSTVQVFGDLEGSEYDLDSERLIILASK